MNRKRLYVLRHRPGGPILKDDLGHPYYFSDKRSAKAQRDLDTTGNVVVSVGPDHYRWNGGKSDA